MRDWINANKLPVAAGTVVVLAIALGVVFWMNRPPGLPDYYYYDLQTGDLFSVASAETSARPVEEAVSAPSGAEGVRAYVYSCGRCTESERYIGYIEGYSEEAREARQQMQGAYGGVEEGPAAIEDVPAARRSMRPAQLEQMIRQGRLIAKASTSPQWFPAESPQAREIMIAALNPCEDGTPPKQCHP